MERKSGLWSKIRTPFKVIIAVVLTLAMIGVLVKLYYFEDTDNARIAKLARELHGLKSAMNVDSVRQYNIQKIISIIDQYNAKMPTSEKYEIADEIYNMSVKYTNLSVELICATITHESAGTWDPEIVSPAGAMGLMQIMPTTGMFVANYEGITWSSAEILFNPFYNIRIGSRYLSSLIESYDVDGGLAAYNGGEKRASLWIKSGRENHLLFSETRNYVPAVIKLYNEYQNLTL